MDFKEISLDGLTPFAKGATGECYRIEEDKIVKLYYDGFPKERVLQEKKNAKTAFVAGISTPISFELVFADGRFGIIYELIGAKTISEVLQLCPHEAEEIGRKIGILAKKLHKVNVNDFDFPKSTEKIAKSLPYAKYLDGNTRNNVEKFMLSLDKCQGYVHGDFHTNNIMMVKDEMMLIDMGSFSIGSPLFDLAVMHFSFFDSPESCVGDISQFNGLTRHVREAVWKSFINKYFMDSSQIEKQEQMQTLDKVIALIKLRYEALYGSKASEDYCKKVREEILVKFK